MPRACCAKPVVKIIKVADVEAGLMGLEQALQNVYIADLNDEEQIKNELLQWIRDFGNYVTPSREEAYKEALLREYKLYLTAMEQAIHERAAERQGRSEKEALLPKWKGWFHLRKRRS
jgi:hypothetical protein